MILTVRESHLSGIIFPPPSKSHSLRALFLAALSQKVCMIENLLESGDINSAICCFEKLGVKINNHTAELQRKDWNIESSVQITETAERHKSLFCITPPAGGIAAYISKQKKPIILNAGNSGSLLYFLPMTAAALPGYFIFSGDKSLSQRPIKPVTEILDCMNVRFKTNAKAGHSILEISGENISSKKIVKAQGKFSQPVSGLLLACPSLYADTEIHLACTGELPYIKMTLQRLKEAGAEIDVSEDFKNYLIKGGQKIHVPYTSIPSDWSSAAFIILAAIATNSAVKIPNMDIADTQGDSAILSFLNRMNAPIVYNRKKKELEIKPHNGELKGSEFDLGGTPDLLPVMAAAALFAKGKTILKNISICRNKECDRVKAVAEELTKLGGNIREGTDCIEIRGGNKLKPAVTESRGDHRIAMMLACTALGIPCKNNKEAVKIKDFQCYSVSYPNFITSLQNAGADFS